MNTTSNTSTQTQERLYNDFHSTGEGFINRIREVTPPRGGASFWCCDVAVRVGKKADKQTTLVDCRVVGEEAQKLIERCKPAFDRGDIISAKFVIGDIYPESFIYGPNHNKAGQQGVCLKGRLLRFNAISIKRGDQWLKVWPENAEPEDNSNQEQAPEQAEQTTSTTAPNAGNSVPTENPPFEETQVASNPEDDVAF